MNPNHTYTLPELAEATGLTERTVRYYIEQVLPPHHKQGRGKLAQYSQDTLNCLRFIVLAGERHGIKPGQAKGVLASVPQETIDRVVRGEEELAVMTVPTELIRQPSAGAGRFSRASKRMENIQARENRHFGGSSATEHRASYMLKSELRSPDRATLMEPSAAFSLSAPDEPWQTIFSDGQLRIQYRGNRKLTAHQQEQIEVAARLIELALK